MGFAKLILEMWANVLHTKSGGQLSRSAKHNNLIRKSLAVGHFLFLLSATRDSAFVRFSNSRSLLKCVLNVLDAWDPLFVAA